MREFIVTGLCVRDMHYMVNIEEKIEQIFRMVDERKYFTINRGRQYGKTTTIGRLEKRLVGEPCRTMVGEPCRTMVGEPCRTMPEDYLCINISFQFSNDKMFANEAGFCIGLLNSIGSQVSGFRFQI